MALYRSCGADILCLQEVQDDRTFHAVQDSIGLEGAYCPGRQYPQYGGAIFWRRGRLVADSLATASPVQRMWQIAECTSDNGVAVTVCNVHLASAKQLGKPAAAGSRVRDIEQVVLSAGRPLVIAGDLNEVPGGTATACLVAQGYLDVAVLANQAIESTGLGKKRSDQVWIHESLRTWVNGFEVIGWERLRTRAPGKEWLSDHLPLLLTLDAGSG